MPENAFRLLAALLPLVAMSMSVYYRTRADRLSGGRVSTRLENRGLFVALRLGGLMLWLTPFLYAISPQLTGWATLALPTWALRLRAAHVFLLRWMSE
jgi:hypothetical protein